MTRQNHDEPSRMTTAPIEQPTGQLALDGVEPPTFSGIPRTAPRVAQAEPGGSWRPDWIFLTLAAMTGIPAVAMFVTDDFGTIGILATIMMLGLIFLKLPVAIALAVPGILGTWAMRGFPAAESSLTRLPYETIAVWTLSVVPMFVFMGLLLWRSGITTDLYIVGSRGLSWLPGGLGVGTNFAGLGFAAVSGSSVATTYALARVGIPEMIKAGYDRRLAMGSVIVAGLGGQVLPPSIMLIIFAGIASTPVGPQLLAGIGPGLFIPVLFTIAIVLVATFIPGMVDKEKEAAMRAEGHEGSLWSSLKMTWPVPVMVLIVTGSMFSGVFTATEAGASAALFAFLLTAWWRRKGGALSAIWEAARGTIGSTGAIFFMLLGATIFARMLALTGLPRNLAGWVESVGFSRISFLMFLVLLYLVLGMFMDPLSMMLLTVPTLMPTLAVLDISLLWFGVFIVFMGELAVLTPPVGVLLYILHGVAQDPEVNQGVEISIKDSFQAVFIFLPFAVIMAVIMIFWPELVTYIPDNFGPR